jgi:hypothetical protein
MNIHHKINCPRCGKEYLPAEIFIPAYFMGKISYIERDENNRIVSIVGSDMDLSESFTCDNCSCLFHITSEISFTVFEDKVGNFDEEYITKL